MRKAILSSFFYFAVLWHNVGGTGPKKVLPILAHRIIKHKHEHGPPKFNPKNFLRPNPKKILDPLTNCFITLPEEPNSQAHNPKTIIQSFRKIFAEFERLQGFAPPYVLQEFFKAWAKFIEVVQRITFDTFLLKEQGGADRYFHLFYLNSIEQLVPVFEIKYMSPRLFSSLCADLVLEQGSIKLPNHRKAVKKFLYYNSHKGLGLKNFPITLIDGKPQIDVDRFFNGFEHERMSRYNLSYYILNVAEFIYENGYYSEISDFIRRDITLSGVSFGSMEFVPTNPKGVLSMIIMNRVINRFDKVRLALEIIERADIYLPISYFFSDWKHRIINNSFDHPEYIWYLERMQDFKVPNDKIIEFRNFFFQATPNSITSYYYLVNKVKEEWRNNMRVVQPDTSDSCPPHLFERYLETHTQSTHSDEATQPDDPICQRFKKCIDLTGSISTSRVDTRYLINQVVSHCGIEVLTESQIDFIVKKYITEVDSGKYTYTYYENFQILLLELESYCEQHQDNTHCVIINELKKELEEQSTMSSIGFSLSSSPHSPEYPTSPPHHIDSPNISEKPSGCKEDNDQTREVTTIVPLVSDSVMFLSLESIDDEEEDFQLLQAEDGAFAFVDENLTLLREIDAFNTGTNGIIQPLLVKMIEEILEEEKKGEEMMREGQRIINATEKKEENEKKRLKLELRAPKEREEGEDKMIKGGDIYIKANMRKHLLAYTLFQASFTYGPIGPTSFTENTVFGSLFARVILDSERFYTNTESDILLALNNLVQSEWKMPQYEEARFIVLGGLYDSDKIIHW